MKGQIYKVKIGLGGVNGQLNEVFITEDKKKIEKRVFNHGQAEVPIIKVRQLPDIKLGGLTTLLRNKRTKHTLQQQLKINPINFFDINEACERMMKNIIEEEQMLGIFKEENQDEKQNKKFMDSTKASMGDAVKYRQKYKNNAVQKYKQHQDKIQKFMKLNSCNRQNAVAFLEENNYDMSMFE